MLKLLIENFIVHLRITNKSQETIIAYRKELSYFMNFAQEKLNCRVYIEDIDIILLESYIIFIKDTKGCMPATINRAIHAIRSFYNYLVKRELYTRNIAAMLEPAKLQQKERDYLTEDEFKRLLAEIDNELIHIVLMTLYYTGVRINECINLKLSEVDFDRMLIRVIAGKGNKDRTIPINTKLFEALSKYIYEVRPTTVSERFFASETSGKISREYINRSIKKATQKANLNKNVTCHILRHSFATNLVSKNVNIVHVQKLLGHSSLNVTAIYTHTSIPELQKTVNML